MFDIRIYESSVYYLYEDVPHCLGEIVIGDFSELFEMPLDYWTIEQYQQQWREGLSRILENKTSCLITEIRDPKISRHVNMWPMYQQKNDTIAIQNQWFFGPIYKKYIGKKLVTLASCYDFISEFELISVYEDGSSSTPSTWYTDAAAIRECLRSK